MKSIRTLIAAGLVLTAMLAACAGTKYKPVEAKTKYSEDILFDAARRSLEDADLVVINRNRDEYTMETRVREVATSSIPKLSYRYHYTVSTKEGVLNIAAECEENSALARTKFEKCSSYPSELLAELSQLKDDILERAKTTDDPSFDWEAAEKKAYAEDNPPEPEEKEKTEEKKEEKGSEAAQSEESVP